MSRTFEGVRSPLIVLCGPTASGKTSMALGLATRFDVEIVSADSRQVYRGMDIGTAKATTEERRRVPHHLIDVVNPDQDFTTADFARLGQEIVGQIHRRGRLPLVVGGTGLYIRTLTEGLLPAPGEDKELRRQLQTLEENEGEGELHRCLQKIDPLLASRLHPRDRVRIIRAIEVFTLTGKRLSALQEAHAFGDHPFRLLKFGLAMEREQLYRLIDSRVETMMAAGFIDEVRGLLANGYSPSLKTMQTIGYREILQHLKGSLSLDETVALIKQATRRYAKRQLTWFRKDKSIIWVDSLREFGKIHSLIGNFMQH